MIYTIRSGTNNFIIETCRYDKLEVLYRICKISNETVEYTTYLILLNNEPKGIETNGI